MNKNYHLIIGGCGFIGSNLAAKLLREKKTVVVFDNLSRPGSEKNLEWLDMLSRKCPHKFFFVRGDIVHDTRLLAFVVSQAKVIYHLAAQVAVTSSVINPSFDFEVNALGTFNVLEAVRKNNIDAILIYSSTNKVYGGMDDVTVLEKKTRYKYKDLKNGISENQPLDFHSPYGCSKGTGDQYVRDYSRIYGIKTVVFRQSCIYGPRQFGVEDQGWLAWFIIALMKKKKITIYGDGKQVRDVLYVGDLINAYSLAVKKINKVSGQIFNIGGGLKYSISVWSEFQPILENHFKRKIKVEMGDWRPGDQKIYISNNHKAHKYLNWKPRVSPKEGIKKLYQWVKSNEKIFNL